MSVNDLPVCRGRWPARWITVSEDVQPPLVAAYRRRFETARPAAVRLRATADERYELFLDGKRIGRGPERGDPAHWFYETYELSLDAGPHMLVARVWSLGRALAPFAQRSLRHGFLLASDAVEPVLNTGQAPWEAKTLKGYSFRRNEISWGVGPDETLDGSAFDWGCERGEGAGWGPVQCGPSGWDAFSCTAFEVDMPLLRPALLPPMFREQRAPGVVRFVGRVESEDVRRRPVLAAENLSEEAARWNGLLSRGTPVAVAPNRRLRIVLDLQDYCCAYPRLVVSGGRGASVRIHWAESLYDEPREDPSLAPKGNRDKVDGKFFIGVGDEFKPDGGAHRLFEKLWWRAGRYLELLVRTADEPLTMESLLLEETRYPLEMGSRFDCDEKRIAECWPILVRSMQMCSHETFLDCPYYEQLMYVGDSRLIALTGYCMTRDDRLARKAVECFQMSHAPSGLTQSRYPTRIPQFIPPFSLWWAAMVHDFALWRGDREFVRARMPGVRGVVDAFLNRRGSDGLVVSVNGWNFMDWAPEWTWGVPPDGEAGVSGLINWQFALVLRRVAELEQWLGEPELAARARRLAEAAARAAAARFWNEERGLFADDAAGEKFSEHTQCLALLGGLLEPSVRERVARGLFADPNLVRTTIYFTHYYFETCRLTGRMDKFFERLALWFDLKPRGFKTTFETPGNTRSDCHAWGAHPIYHCFATIMGIRPGGFGFRTVEIAPQLGPLRRIEGSLAHPSGEIAAELRREDGRLIGFVSLPPEVTGKLHWQGNSVELAPGRQDIRIEAGG